MASNQPQAAQDEIEVHHFPGAGIDVSAAFGKQPVRQGSNGQYRRTCAMGVNVRCYDPSENRSSGGARPGLEPYIEAKVAGQTWIVQELAAIVHNG